MSRYIVEIPNSPITVEVVAEDEHAAKKAAKELLRLKIKVEELVARKK